VAVVVGKRIDETWAPFDQRAMGQIDAVSEHMASIAGLGTGTVLLMASNALIVEGIAAFDDFSRIIFARIVTLVASLGDGGMLLRPAMAIAAGTVLFLTGRVMMAIGASQAVTLNGQMRPMIEKHLARIGLIHHAQRRIRGFGRMTDVADNRNHEEDDGKAIGQLQLLVGGHCGGPFTDFSAYRR
jgi:hypothetical protein